MIYLQTYFMDQSEQNNLLNKKVKSYPKTDIDRLDSNVLLYLVNYVLHDVYMVTTNNYFNKLCLIYYVFYTFSLTMIS